MAMHFCISASASHWVWSLGKSLVLMLEDYFGIQSTCYPAAWIILELVVGCTLYSADTACSTFIWGLTLMSTNNQPEQAVYQPIQGLNSTPQGVMPRIHGSKKHRVYLKLSLFRISMTVVHQSFQHATYAKGYNKELFSLVANPGVIDCHTLAGIGLVCFGSVNRDGIFKADAVDGRVITIVQ